MENVGEDGGSESRKESGNPKQIIVVNNPASNSGIE